MSNMAMIAALSRLGDRGGGNDRRNEAPRDAGMRYPAGRYDAYEPIPPVPGMAYNRVQPVPGMTYEPVPPVPGMTYEPIPPVPGMTYNRMPMDARRYPARRMRGDEIDDRYPAAHMPYIPPVAKPIPRYDGPEEEEEPEMMGDNITPIDAYRRIGFGEMRRSQPRWQNGRFKPRGEMEEMMAPMDHYGAEEPHQMRIGGAAIVESGIGKTAKLSRAQADEWVESMENDSEQHPKGGAFSFEMAKDWALKVGIQPVGQRMIDFYAAMNAMYSDYSSVAAKYKVDVPEFYAHMAKAFIDDPDAVKNKTAMYYKCIVDK